MLLAILRNQPEIHELLPLPPLDSNGEQVIGEFPEDILRMLIRLQNLMMMEVQKRASLEQPRFEHIAKEETATARIRMLELLMQEVVRDVVPEESTRDMVRYWVNGKSEVIRTELGITD